MIIYKFKHFYSWALAFLAKGILKRWHFWHRAFICNGILGIGYFYAMAFLAEYDRTDKFLLITNQTEFHWVHNHKENCQCDHIRFNLKKAKIQQKFHEVLSMKSIYASKVEKLQWLGVQLSENLACLPKMSVHHAPPLKYHGTAVPRGLGEALNHV